MKRLVAFLCSLLLCFTFVSCGKQSPSDTVSSFLDAIKKSDSSTIEKIYASGSFDADDILSDSDDKDSNADNQDSKTEDLDSFGDEFQKQLLSKLADFDYEISKEKIDGDKAKVDVTFTTYEFGNAFNLALSEYMQKSLALVFAGSSESEIQAIAESVFKEEFDKLTEKKFTKTITIPLTQKDGKWIIDDLSSDENFFDAISGNLYSTVKSLDTL